MQVTQTLSDGLKREYRVVVNAAELASRQDARINELKGQINIQGFRPGKVPVAHIKRIHGKSIMAETIESIIEEANSKIATDGGYKFASAPKPALPEDEADAMKVINGNADLDYAVSFEILPKIEVGDLKAVTVEKPVAVVSDAEVQEMLGKMAKSNREYEPKTGAAVLEDSLKIDFVGSIDGEEFEGGAGKDAQLVLGSNTFIPGFEEQLIGKNAGDACEVNVTFPENYGAAHLANKAAVFKVNVNSVESPKAREINDDMAVMMGFESLEKLTTAVKERLEGEYAGLSRTKAKRSLLDGLDKAYAFDLPEGLVTQEFNNVWGQVQSEMAASQKTFEQEDTTEEKAKEDYAKIANRRVRLGLLLAEIGEKQNITVTDEELTRAVIEQVRQFPGQEKQIYDYLRQNQQALASMRAPIFEDKVVDYLLGEVTLNEKSVTKEELFVEDDVNI
jgi:trigger factor